MSGKKGAVWAACGLAVLFLACGCGQKRIVGTEVPQQPGSGETAAAAKAALAASGRYRVSKNDCLWSIAGQSRVYGDSFLWPELFKANRDQIQDPDLIYPRQDLRVQRGFTAEETNRARQLAMSTPKYAPHSKPRETLPLDYF